MLEKLEHHILSIKIPCKPEFVSVVRLVIAGLASRLNYQQEDIEDLRVAVAEACNNAILESGNKGDISIDCMIEREKLSVIVTDRPVLSDTKSCNACDDYNKGFNNGQHLSGADLEDAWLLLIRALMDEVDCSMERGWRRKVTMVKYCAKVAR